MPKFQIVSDIHVEFYKHPEDAFDFEIEPDAHLIIAGDLATYESIDRAVSHICKFVKKAGNGLVFFVLGNHEFYGRVDYGTMIAKIHGLKNLNDNFVFLHNTLFVDSNGCKIAGTPLWFSYDPLKDSRDAAYMNCFVQIAKFDRWVNEENKKSVDFLSKVNADIIITHYLPSEQCVAQMYKGDPLNKFFVCSVLENKVQHMPKFWIHGHTHESIDLQLGPTHVICNPRGYRHERNKNFKKVVIEL